MLPEETYDLSTTLSLEGQPHRDGASYLDVTSSCSTAAERRTPLRLAARRRRRSSLRKHSTSRTRQVMFRRLRVRLSRRLTRRATAAQPRAALRRRDHQDIPDGPPVRTQTTSTRARFAWDPRAIRVGIRGGVGHFTPQHAVLTSSKRRRRTNATGDTVAGATDPLFPTARHPAGFPPGAVLPARSIQEISPDSRTTFRNGPRHPCAVGRAQRVSVDFNITAA